MKAKLKISKENGPKFCCFSLETTRIPLLFKNTKGPQREQFAAFPG